MELSTRTRIRTGLLLLLLITAGTRVWYWWTEQLSVIDAVYQTAITISKVGFTELVEFSETTRLVTIGVIVLGAGTTAYTLTALFEQFADERIENARRRRMERSAKGMVDHMIVCGYGRVGSKVAADAARKGGEVVVIEHDAEPSQAAADAGFTVIRGSATEDRTRESAGIQEAAVLVAAIDSDAENVSIVLSARATNPDVRIVARATTNESAPKLVQAGADRVINPKTSVQAACSHSLHGRRSPISSMSSCTVTTCRSRWIRRW
ncbi:MAG: potassium channel family protein [Nitriliruptoraceae bacterium]